MVGLGTRLVSTQVLRFLLRVLGKFIKYALGPFSRKRWHILLYCILQLTRYDIDKVIIIITIIIINKTRSETLTSACITTIIVITSTRTAVIMKMEEVSIESMHART